MRLDGGGNFDNDGAKEPLSLAIGVFSKAGNQVATAIGYQATVGEGKYSINCNRI